MTIKILRDINDGNVYNIYNEEFLLKAKYDAQNKRQQLFDISGTLLGEGFYDLSNKRIFYALMPYYIWHHQNPNFITTVEHSIFPYVTYGFTFQNDKYLSIRHRGYKVSIFKNDKQIGFYLTGKTVRDTSWDMMLVTNSDIDTILILLFSLYIYSDFENESTVEGGNSNYHIGFQKQRFDATWIPNR